MAEPDKAGLAQYSDKNLVARFNKEVGNKGWGSARAELLAAIRQEFERRGLDYTEIGDEKTLSLRNPVILIDKKIMVIHPC